MLGADSTTTYGNPTGPHYFNHAQKLFQVGENSSLGIVTWGLGGLQVNSYRTLFARLADELNAAPPTSVEEAANRWASLFWAEYNSSAAVAPLLAIVKALETKMPHVPTSPANPTMRTADEEKQLGPLKLALTAGFCIGGCMQPGREPAAYQVIFEPHAVTAPIPSLVAPGYSFNGAPNMIGRLLTGVDEAVKADILTSGKWVGSAQDLDALLSRHRLDHPIVPIRDAVDFIHSCISSTIKAFKFSNLSQICGGPIELAVITSDRSFRWVRHKEWDSAITEGGL